MLDIRRIRENLEEIKAAMDRRGEKEFDLDAVVALDSTFNSFFITSTSLSKSLLLSSNATTASRSNSFSPLLSIAFFMSSKFYLILFISSILLPPIFRFFHFLSLRYYVDYW